MKTTRILKRLSTAAIVLLAGLPAWAQPFDNPLPIPHLMTGSTFNISVENATHNFDPNHTVTAVDLDSALSTYCFNEAGQSQMSYLGPTLAWTKGQTMQVNATNNLANDPTTMHWHGLNLHSRNDGGPHEAFASGNSWNPTIPIIDSVQTLWYHSHLMDLTTEQVILGLAGMLIVEDPSGDPLRALLPHDYGVNDIPLVIQEKAFVFDTIGNTVKATGLKVSEKPGNGPYTLLNGVVNAVVNVPQEMVRFRVLNGSPRKVFHFGISTSLTANSFATMNQIATDGGYTSQPHALDSALIAPGERLELVIDFSGYANGDTVYLRNLARSIPKDANYGSTPGAAFMAFVVDNSIQPTDPITSLPTSLEPYSVDSTGVFRHRTKKLLGAKGSGGVWTIDSMPMDMGVINDTVLVNTKEKWTIENTTDVSHPFHIHKVQFQVIRYEGNIGVDSVSNPGTYTYPNLPEYMMGYKDVLLIRAGAKMTFVARFDSFPDTAINPMDGFMYHCHILTHEDMSMMHQFVVVDSNAYYGTTSIAEKPVTGTPEVYPNPTRNRITLRGTLPMAGRLRFIDLTGRTLREMPLAPLDGTVELSVENLPRGMIFVEYSSESQRWVKKVLLE